MGASRILVVDDDLTIRRLLETALALDGLDVVAVDSGPAALDRLRQERFDAVLLDRLMPGMDGIEVLTRIRADPRTATVPVLLITGVADHRSVIEGLDRGADDYITKPFDPHELAARVRSQLRGHRAWSDRLSDAARGRSVLAEAASAGGTAAPSLHAAAAALCERLAAEPEIAGVEILERSGPRWVSLARAGEGSVAVLHGAVGDRLAVMGRSSNAGPMAMTVDDGPVAAAPIRDATGVLGVAVLTGVTDEPGESGPGSRADLLALAVDVAALAGGVLGEALRSSQRRLRAQEQLRRLVAAGGFATVFQPIIDLTDDAVAGHEALTRFEDGLAAGEVFGTAIRLGVARELEQATLAAALDRAARQPDGCWLALNVTPSFVLGAADLDRILRVAGRSDIVLEISEMEQVHDYGALHDAIDGLGAAVQISVDDAGAGFSSLDHILALEARYVKLDRSWVHGLDHDPAKRALVAGLQSFAAETGAAVIAEGIETQDQLAAVRDLGIPFGQGWLLGMPAQL